MLPLVVTVESTDGSIRRYAFADSPISIGRSPFAELQLVEPFVSRWEGTLRFDEREITYFSLGATNPTFIDGREVVGGEDSLLGAHSTLSIGELRLRFARAAVPEGDIRRRGKKKPVLSNQDSAVKTAYLEAPATSARTPPAPVGAVSRGAPPATRGEPPFSVIDRQPVPAAPHSMPPPAERQPMKPTPRGDVRVLGRVTVAGGMTAATDETRQYASRPGGHERPPAIHGASWGQQAEAGPGRASDSRPPVPGAHARPLPDLYKTYRESWRQVLEQLVLDLERSSGPQRTALADELQRSYPQVTSEPEFREVLKRLGLPARRPEVFEVRAWLMDIARDVLPAKLKLDTGLTLDRVLGLLEALTQSLAEINDAQDTVRQRWLGRSPRPSVLRSENGRAILAYLLNPQADWDDRLLELEQTIREVVTHELALFKATMEGARQLVESISPRAIAEAEGVDPESLESLGKTSGLWARRGKEGIEARLWRRYLSQHEALTDGDRYQRVFLGRIFARTYLAAMGRGGPEDR